MYLHDKKLRLINLFMNTQEEIQTNQQLYALCEGEAQKKMFNDYLKIIGKCEKCGTSDYVSYIVIGRPSSSLSDFAYKTHLVCLGGCSPLHPAVNQSCRKCGTRFYFNQ
jgi:hypothetical protein